METVIGEWRVESKSITTYAFGSDTFVAITRHM